MGKIVPYSFICFFVLLPECVFMPLSAFSAFNAFYCFLALFVRTKSFRKKNKEFKTALITSFILLLSIFKKIIVY